MKNKRINSYNGLHTLIMLALSVLSFFVFFSYNAIASTFKIWYRIEVSNTGLYRITKKQLHEMGFDNPMEVAVVGRGGELMSEYIDPQDSSFYSVRPTFVDEQGDLFFFSTGLTNWYYDQNSKMYRHITNHYTNKAFVVLTNFFTPKHLSSQSIPTVENISVTDKFVDVYTHEKDDISLSESGRKLFGEALSDNVPVRVNIPNPYRADHLKGFVAWSILNSVSDVTLSVDLGTKTILNSTSTLSQYRSKATLNTYKLFGIYNTNYNNQYEEINGKEEFSLSLKISRNDQSSSFIDYIDCNLLAKAQLLPDRQQIFRAPSNYNGIRVVGLKDNIILRLDQQQNDVVMYHTQKNTAVLPFIDNNQYYIITSKAQAYPIVSYNRIQNFPDISNKLSPDLIIITTESLRAQAERLASFRRLNDGLNVLVISQQEIFDRFNGGTADATAYRLLVNYLQYYTGSNNTTNLSVLLFGDALYDNRKISSALSPNSANIEYLLSYQSDNSLDIDSYTSDDYFVVTDSHSSNERSFNYRMPINLERYPLTFSVGRIPAQTVAEASAVVDKIISYSHMAGEWQMKTVFVADNGDGNSHIKQSSEVSDIIESLQPALECNKIYMAQYPRVSTGGKISVPEAKQKLMDAINTGTLLVNYNGHGSPVSWADEQILTISDIKKFTHTKLPLWITATCDFTNFDSSNRSAGEEILLQPRTGGIALLTTSRVVWDIPNIQLNKAVIRALFDNGNHNEVKTLGMVIRDAKNSLINSQYPINRLNFTLLGDPSISVGLPKNKIKIRSINGQSESPIIVGALQRVSVDADVIEKKSDQIDESFTGEAFVSVFDSKKDIATIDNFDRGSNSVPPFKYKEYSNRLFTSKVNVTNGRLHFDFVIPRDVSYTGNSCRINIYAYDKNKKNAVIGVDYSLLVTGKTSQNQTNDTIPPVIKSLKLSGKPFVDGIIVSDNPVFYAELWDDTSINISEAGLGHSITLSIDGSSEFTYVLSPAYESSDNDLRSGSLTFSLPSLSEGDHTARFVVWDVVGNVTIRTIKFRVAYNIKPSITKALIYPNPLNLSLNKSLNINLSYNGIGNIRDAELTLFDLSSREITRLPINIIDTLKNGEERQMNVNFSNIDILPGIYLVQIRITSQKGVSSFVNKSIILRD